MICNRVNRLRATASAAFIGMIFLFWAGAVSSSAQPRAHYRARPVAVTTVRTHSVAYVRTGYGRAGHTRARYARAAVRPVYSTVNVNLEVSPVYPEAGWYSGPAYQTAGWYASYPYPYPYVTYANGYYPYQYYAYYPYYVDLTAQGYRDGLHRGQDDAEDHRFYDPYRKGFKNPESVAYSNGFLNGYAVGYSR